ncbi:MAG: Ribosomal protein L11 methyltransferase [Firmicutes bacterium ADurb.Bin080]|jgi:ribosomal protein L11 methyltransferase|nr:50S ribosomal protein L11 methyltransferase [Clostridiales bacterium]OQC12708.1 MAG: Ribosomal protein L11 methyltransferase [Firmicutes bacterium ADurb.Bin080]
MKKELSVLISRTGADYIVSSFFSLGITELKINDSNAINEVISSNIVWDYIDDKLIVPGEDTVEIIAYLEESNIEKTIEYIKNEMNSLTEVNYEKIEFSVNDFIDIDWLSEWKKYYKPIRCGKILVVPSWLRDSEQFEGSIPVFIKPGCSFGTGDHESTRMCLELLSKLELAEKSLADVGSGSGILGISALKLGGSKCCFFDIDLDSLSEAKNNYIINFCSNLEFSCDDNYFARKNVFFVKSNLLNESKKKFDIILANITADPLIKLSKDIKNHLMPNGFMICSGIIEKYRDYVVQAYEKEGLLLEREVVDNGWIAQLYKFSV